MFIITTTISQVARRSTLSKKTLARAYFATPVTYFSSSGVKQKQEDIQQQTSGPESTVYVSHEGSDPDALFSPVINHVFDD